MKKIAFLFPGQGSQYVGMGLELYKQDTLFKQILDDCCEYVDMDLFDVLNDKEKLSDTAYTQFAISCISFAYYQKFIHDYKIVPKVIAGHSLGEITALTAANVISFSDALPILRVRGDLMKKATEYKEGGMSAIINIQKEKIKELCAEISENTREIVEVANYNSSAQCVVSGTIQGIVMLGKKAENANGVVIPLQVSGAFHSSLMEGIQLEFYHYLKSYVFKKPMLKVISSVTAQVFEYEKATDILTKQLVSPVLWTDVIKKILKEEVEVIVEAGPKSTLTKLLKRDFPNLQCLALDEVYKKSIDLSKIIC